jgi:nucleoside phosphorylase
MSDMTMGAHAGGVDASESVTAVLAAMPEEAAVLRAALGELRCVRRREPQIVLGRLAGRAVALCVTGDGARNAQVGAEVLLATLSVGELLVIGVSGALSASLEPGALIVAERVVRERGREPGAARDVGRDSAALHCAGLADGLGALQPSAALVERAVRAAGARRAVVVCSHQLADSALAKRRLLSDAQCGDGAVVVDLESASYAAAAQAARVPWLILRAISDTSEEALPALLNRCRDSGGAVRRGGVLRGLLSDPRPLPTLLRLRRRVEHCAPVLARAASAVIFATRTAQLSVATAPSE